MFSKKKFFSTYPECAGIFGIAPIFPKKTQKYRIFSSFSIEKEILVLIVNDPWKYYWSEIFGPPLISNCPKIERIAYSYRKNADFWLSIWRHMILWRFSAVSPRTLNLQLFHVPGMLEPRNWVENRAMYTPLSISSFGSFTDTVRSCDNADFRPAYYEK